MLKPDIPPDQLQTLQAIVEPLLARLRAHVEKLPPQADSALVYPLGDHEAGQ